MTGACQDQPDFANRAKSPQSPRVTRLGRQDGGILTCRAIWPLLSQ
jgi:hypothetical protein